MNKFHMLNIRWFHSWVCFHTCKFPNYDIIKHAWGWVVTWLHLRSAQLYLWSNNKQRCLRGNLFKSFGKMGTINIGYIMNFGASSTIRFEGFCHHKRSLYSENKDLSTWVITMGTHKHWGWSRIMGGVGWMLKWKNAITN